MKRPSTARGQTLVLFAVTMLMTALLVMMTLAISTRVKEKMELQAVADAAAYSNAVVTARAYNEIALMSRAQIGKMVSMAAVQSLISWSSYYRAQVEATRRSYSIARLPYIALLLCCIPTSGCTQYCGCARQAISDINDTRDKLAEHQQELRDKWERYDVRAGQQAKNLHTAAWVLYGGQVERYGRLRDKLGGQEVARDIVREARAGSRWPGEWSAPGSGDEVSIEEAVGIPLLSGRGGAIIPMPLPLPGAKNHHIYAAMGSRGYTFTTQRSRGAVPIIAQLKRQLPREDQVLATNSGNAYFATAMNHGRLFPSGEFSWADDHSDPRMGPFANITTFNRGQPPCFRSSIGFANASSRVRSTSDDDNTDVHVWSPGGEAEEVERHNLGICIGLDCPGIWPMFVDYNPLQVVSGEDNLWGQPKNHAVIQRDYSVRSTPRNRDPWILDFSFDFTGTSESAQSGFDNRGVRLSPQNGNLDISRQTALSTGIAYYHRYDHWKEPPNLLNPYWRATLVPFDVDEDGPSDVRKTLRNVGVDWAAEAAGALEAAQYKGGP
jgi:Putative Flp pilus-assembly TadE/G-like